MVPIGTWRDEHGMSMGWTWDGWWDELVMGYSWDIWGRNWIFSWDMCDDTLVTSVTWMICMIFLINPESPWIRKSKEAIQFYKDVLQYTANVATWQFWQLSCQCQLRFQRWSVGKAGGSRLTTDWNEGVPEGRPKREQWNSHLRMTQLARQGENAFGAHLGP